MSDPIIEILIQVTRIADALDILARAGAPADPNYVKPINEYSGFDWATIGATVVSSDKDGPTHLEHSGFVWTRRSPSNKFSEAIWYSRANGKDADGNTQYLRLITFRKIGEADPIPDKVAAAIPAASASKPVQPSLQPAQAPAATNGKQAATTANNSQAADLKQEKASAGTLNNGVPRPYAPEMLRTKLASKAINYSGKAATTKQVNLAAMVLTEIFAGPGSELSRHALQMYLFGKASLSEVDGSLILVMLNDWLKPVKDSGGGYHADPMAVREAQAAYQEALKAQGQLGLPITEGEQEKIPF